MISSGYISILSTIKYMGKHDFNYLNCPICKEAISTNKAKVMGHLNKHAKNNELPRNYSGYIAEYAANVKGCNKLIDTLDDEKKNFIKDFVAKMRVKSDVDPNGIMTSYVKIN